MDARHASGPRTAPGLQNASGPRLSGAPGPRAAAGRPALAAVFALLLLPTGASAQRSPGDGARGPFPAAAPQGSALADAAMRGERERVRSLLAEGADPDAPRGDGTTALHWAAERGDAELARLLLDAGAGVDPVARNGRYRPLHLAARSGAADVVRRLLAAGSDPAASALAGTTALHLAAGAGSAEAVRALLDAGVDPDVQEDAWRQTPLMFAASQGRVAALEALLERGADPELTTRVVDLPAREAADEAAGERRAAVLAQRRERAAGDPRDWRPEPEDVQAAVRAAHQVQRAADTAAAGGANRDGAEATGYTALVGTQGGLTALLHAVREGHTPVVRALLAAGADVDRPSAGDGTTPLLMAMINGHFDLGLLLLERGADPDRASEAGTTPLFAALNVYWAPKSRYPQQHAHMLQEATYLDVMEALLEAGADPNRRLDQHLWYMSYTFDLLDVDTRGATPFWRAAYATDVAAMRLLAGWGADPHVATVKPVERRRGAGGGGEDPSGLPPVPDGGPGVWPIHAASGVGYGEGYAGNAHRHAPDAWLPAVRYLVEELGADVNARDHNGYTALHHAAARGDDELILYLVERGADVAAVSRRGQTTADMANGPVQRISPFLGTVALLEGLGSKNNHRCMSC